MKVAVLFSGGKDSTYTLWIALQQYDVAGIVTVLSSDDSYLYHYQKTEIAKTLSEAIDIPMTIVEVEKSSEEYNAVLSALQKMNIEALLIGGLLSEFQRFKFNAIAQTLNIPCFSPLWRKDNKILLQELKSHFNVIFTTVASMGFNKADIGRKLDDEMFNWLLFLHNKYGVSITGEGGEYETLVLDAPFYKKKIVVEKSSIDWDETKSFGYYRIEQMRLEKK